jgi:uncharacterized protein (DUF1778 family)
MNNMQSLDEVVRLRVSKREKDAFDLAARLQNKNLSAWIREILQSEAKSVMADAYLKAQLPNRLDHPATAMESNHGSAV